MNEALIEQMLLMEKGRIGVFLALFLVFFFEHIKKVVTCGRSKIKRR